MRSMNVKMRSRWSLGVGVAMLVGLAGLGTAATLVVDASPAHAVIGRPLTPGSYAGVARRTSRRTSRRTAYRTAAYTSAYTTTLPAGCAMVGGVYRCGAATYQPYYDGPNLVYVEAG